MEDDWGLHSRNTYRTAGETLIHNAGVLIDCEIGDGFIVGSNSA